MSELQQTKGFIKLYGRVVGMENPNAYHEGITNSGEEFRSLNFGIKTSPNNIIYLDLVGVKLNRKVKVFSNKNNEKKVLEIDFDDRFNLPPGFTPLGFGTIRISLHKDSQGTHNWFNYDGIEILKNTLKDDDSIYVIGEFNPSTYEVNGEKRTKVRYTISRIGYLDNPINFDENFKEVASFEQEFVVIDKNLDKEQNKLYIVARLINYNKKWNDINFVIDANKYKDLASNFYKKTKFGDVIKAQGLIRNCIITQEIEQQEEIDWGGETPEGIGKRVITNRINELEITRVVAHKPGVYKEEDFIEEDDPFGLDDDGLDGSPFDEDEDDIWGEKN